MMPNPLGAIRPARAASAFTSPTGVQAPALFRRIRALAVRLLWVLGATAAVSAPVWAEEATASSTPAQAETAYVNPWAFNLTLYMWLAGVNGNFKAGPISQSVDKNFIDIVDNTRQFPLGFMGRFEAHYERLGFYLDGNYMDLNFKPKFERLSKGVDSELGILDYGMAYRVLGPSAAELPEALGKKNANWLEVYAGGRTIWLDNSVDLKEPFGNPRGGPRSFSASKSFTSPVIGGRFMVGFTPHWFVLVDGNIGGFGAQDVKFTGAVLGALGYRMSLYDIPLSVEAGYKALRYNVDNGGSIETNATLNGPFVGLTGYW